MQAMVISAKESFSILIITVTICMLEHSEVVRATCTPNQSRIGEFRDARFIDCAYLASYIASV